MANFVLESSVLADGSTRTQAKTILSLWHQVQSALELLSQTQGLLQHFGSGIISRLRHLPSGFPGHRAVPDSGNLANQGIGHLGVQQQGHIGGLQLQGCPQPGDLLADHRPRGKGLVPPVRRVSVTPPALSSTLQLPQRRTDSVSPCHEGDGSLKCAQAGGLLQAPEIPTMEPDREPHGTTGTCRVS